LEAILARFLRPRLRRVAPLPEIENLPIKVYPGRARPQIFSSGSVLTIGAFDGLHLGHQRIIERLKLKAKELGLPSAAMSFRPDPAEYFLAQSVELEQAEMSQDCSILMSWRERMLALAATGVDAVLCMPFNKAVSQMAAEDFVRELVHQLGMRYLLVGDDFQFGNGRQGDFRLLTKLGEELGFQVEQSETHFHEGERISSTRVRKALAAGELNHAEILLGRPYEICGRVIQGEQLGVQLGFPTANIALRRRRPAMGGVYAVIAEFPDGSNHKGVANLGIRPAVNSLEHPLLEVHLLDWSGDLYGQHLRVKFVKRLRDEKKFDSLAALKDAIKDDVRNARSWFDNQAISTS